jgi:hypothetical protein
MTVPVPGPVGVQRQLGTPVIIIVSVKPSDTDNVSVINPWQMNLFVRQSICGFFTFTMLCLKKILFYRSNR